MRPEHNDTLRYRALRLLGPNPLSPALPHQGGGGKMGRRRASLITPPPSRGRGRGRGGAPPPTTPSSSPSPIVISLRWAPPVSAPWANQNPSSTTSRPSCRQIKWMGAFDHAQVCIAGYINSPMMTSPDFCEQHA